LLQANRIIMLDRLKKKWNVNGLQLTLILCTFAIGGSLTGYTARKLLGVLSVEQRWLWIIIYILFLTMIWPIAVYLISFPFGQSRFFTRYLKKIGKRFFGSHNPGTEKPDNSFDANQDSRSKDVPISTKPEISKKAENPRLIAIFASGTGSNAQKIIDFFRNSKTVKIALIVCNKPGAGVLNIAKNENIPSLLIEKERFFQADAYINELNRHNISFIVLAGFLWKIPPNLIMAFKGKIINIHPALLPSYGGKGMYGNRVHEAVIAAKEKESGISIHYVDEIYDHGTTIFQATCPVLETDTADSLAQRIHQLEHEHYPKVIDELMNRK
jgi:formyltetrahydrofolate-dependent phosphoribosylglycinamide formyltransferase